MTHNIRIICRGNSSSKVNDNIHKEKKIDKCIEGQPEWLGLVFTVECNADRQHYHGEHQKDNHKYIPVPPRRERNVGRYTLRSLTQCHNDTTSLTGTHTSTLTYVHTAAVACMCTYNMIILPMGPLLYMHTHSQCHTYVRTYIHVCSHMS